MIPRICFFAVILFEAVVLILWVSSFQQRIGFTFFTGEDSVVWMETTRGGVQLINQEQIDASAFVAGWSKSEPIVPVVQERWLGFGHWSGVIGVWDGYSSRSVKMSAYTTSFIPIMLLPLAAYSLFAFERHRRIRLRLRKPVLANESP